MNGKMAAELYKASARTFEDLALLLVSEEISTDQASAPLRAIVRVDFHGPFEGTLVAAFHGNFDRAAATNMLGDEVSCPSETGTDALKEIANVICGNFLPAVFGEDMEFRLEAPRIEAEDFHPGPALHRLEAEIEVGLEGGRARLAVYRRGEVAVGS